jgi:hypothetical protein
MSQMKKLVKSFKDDKYVRIFLPTGLVGVFCGVYLLENGNSKIFGALIPISFSYLLCGTFRALVTLFNQDAPFVRFRLAAILLALYGLLVYGTDHFVSAYVPYPFANLVCQMMAWVCTALALQVLIAPSFKNVQCLERVST